MLPCQEQSLPFPFYFVCQQSDVVRARQLPSRMGWERRAAEEVLGGGIRSL